MNDDICFLFPMVMRNVPFLSGQESACTRKPALANASCIGFAATGGAIVKKLADEG
ncbi:hypothetical protein [Kiloniella antarctica]|uniref:Uncharacterized protein n=1 Tax=Kiloniella antarctica TaxID=1550907 RepID=A0ABW5BLF7_9PROT